MISLVQLVVGITIIHAPCPAYLPDRVSCYDPPTSTIYLVHQPRKVLADEDRLHEEGHADDFHRLTPEARMNFNVILGFKRGYPWWGKGMGNDDDSPGERYAENFMGCALDKAWRIKRFCALLPPSSYAVWMARVR